MEHLHYNWVPQGNGHSGSCHLLGISPKAQTRDPTTPYMRASIFVLFLACLLASCKKESSKVDNGSVPANIVNGINVSTAIHALNEYRTNGIQGYPSVPAVAWNDTLSDAAYNFANAKIEDSIPSSSNYTLSDGQFILDFPAMLNYSGTANFALYYGFPSDADVTTVIDAGFATTDPSILNGLMSQNAARFGMGQSGGNWYLIMSN